MTTYIIILHIICESAHNGYEAKGPLNAADTHAAQIWPRVTWTLFNLLWTHSGDDKAHYHRYLHKMADTYSGSTVSTGKSSVFSHQLSNDLLLLLPWRHPAVYCFLSCQNAHVLSCAMRFRHFAAKDSSPVKDRLSSPTWKILIPFRKINVSHPHNVVKVLNYYNSCRGIERNYCHFVKVHALSLTL